VRAAADLSRWRRALSATTSCHGHISAANRLAIPPHQTHLCKFTRSLFCTGPRLGIMYTNTLIGSRIYLLHWTVHGHQLPSFSATALPLRDGNNIRLHHPAAPRIDPERRRMLNTTAPTHRRRSTATARPGILARPTTKEFLSSYLRSATCKH
jgi:hypothetical protein